MTEFVAVYFMLQLAFAIMICSFIWRFWPLYLASGFCWGMNALYTITQSHGGDVFIWAYSLFCLAMAFAMFFGNWWIPKKFMQKDEYSQFNMKEDWETPKQKRNMAKSWGKPLTDGDKKAQDIATRRARGEYVTEPDDND